MHEMQGNFRDGLPVDREEDGETGLNSKQSVARGLRNPQEVLDSIGNDVATLFVNCGTPFTCFSSLAGHPARPTDARLRARWSDGGEAGEHAAGEEGEGGDRERGAAQGVGPGGPLGLHHPPGGKDRERLAGRPGQPPSRQGRVKRQAHLTTTSSRRPPGFGRRSSTSLMTPYSPK